MPEFVPRLRTGTSIIVAVRSGAVILPLRR